MLSDTHVKRTVDAKEIKCRVIVLVDAEHTVYYLVVCNGTNNYVNHFWADIWNILEIEKIRMNVFEFLMWKACNQSKNWKEFKWQYSLRGNRW